MKQFLFFGFLISIFFVTAISMNAAAQDSLKTTKALVDSNTIKHNPRKAALYSLVPGGGQIFNKKYYKVPVIYVGLSLLTYGVTFNQKNYKVFQDAYILRLDTVPSNDTYENRSIDDIKSQRDFYRRNRDLCYIGLGVVYTLQIIDAYVDAHLFYFTVSDDVSLQWSPSTNLTASQKFIPSLNLCLTF